MHDCDETRLGELVLSATASLRVGVPGDGDGVAMPTLLPIVSHLPSLS